MEENILGTGSIGKLLKKFTLPSIVAMLVAALYNIVDQFFIGQKIGELGNAATNIVFPLTTSTVAISLLFGIGGAAAFNLAMGRGQKDKAVFFFGNAAIMLIIVGTLLFVLAELFLNPMLVMFGCPDDVMGYAVQYTRITAVGFPFIIFSNGGGHLVRADGSPKYSMICNLSGAIINIILDPILIFGFDMDMEGAALATIIGQIVSAILVYRYLRNCKTVTLAKKHLRLKAEYVKKIISLGATPCLNQVAMMVVQITMNKSLTYYGAKSVYGEAIPLACSGIIAKVNQVYFSVVIGLSQGMQPIVSFNYGAKKYDRVKKVYKVSIAIGLTVSILSFIMFQIFPRNIVAIFGEGNDLYFTFAIRYFRIFLFATFVNCLQPLTSNLFTAIGKPKKGIFLSLTRQIIFLLPLIVIFPIIVGIDGIMYAGPVADLMAALASIIMVSIEMKKMKN